MTRTVPGSGASIIPIFNSIFGVRDVYVQEKGSGYDPNDPPRLRVENCGTPIRDAVLRAVIEGDLGELTAVEVLDPGEGYDPLRLKIEDDFLVSRKCAGYTILGVEGTNETSDWIY